jgi:hypothetical protein
MCMSVRKSLYKLQRIYESLYEDNSSDSITLWLDDLRPIRAGFNTLATTASEAIEILKTKSSYKN